MIRFVADASVGVGLLVTSAFCGELLSWHCPKFGPVCMRLTTLAHRAAVVLHGDIARNSHGDVVRIAGNMSPRCR